MVQQQTKPTFGVLAYQQEQQQEEKLLYYDNNNYQHQHPDHPYHYFNEWEFRNSGTL